MIDKIAYALSNPVSSFLVREAVKWPGVRRAWPAPAKVIKRPPLGIFADDERWPAEVTLEMTRPSSSRRRPPIRRAADLTSSAATARAASRTSIGKA
jgi:hypothetical protein